MKKNFTINNKLKAYSSLASSFLAVGTITDADATVIYHDESPDVTITRTTLGTSTYPVDMNSDGITDFNLLIEKFQGTTSSGLTYTGTGVVVEGANANNGVAYNVITTPNTTSSYALALNAGDNINNSLQWYMGVGTMPLAATGTVAGFPISQNEWKNVTDKYLGVKFSVNGSVHYGWIRLDVGAYNTFTIKGWAYENVANQPIQAGQTTATGVNEHMLSTTTIINTNNVVKAEFASPYSGTMQIVSMTGAIVQSVDFSGRSCEANMAGVPSGVYNVMIVTNDGSMAKKVFVD